jgi:hypothetical protein
VRNKDAKDGELTDEVDELFKLPLAEFTGARNSLAAQLKKSGRADDANLVKALAKPSVSAWAVNQLHWNYREELDQLLATAQHIRKAQSSGKLAPLRGSLDARREALSTLSDLAAELLRDAGHNPSPDILHRVTTTLEAVSAYASLSDGPTAGRLTQDVDPPGFDSLTSLLSGAGALQTKVTPSKKSGSATPKTQPKPAPRAEENRSARIAAAKVSLQVARKSLTEARPRAQRLEANQKKAQVEAKEAQAKARQFEKQLREAEQRFKFASAAAEDAAERAQHLVAEAAEATKAVTDAESAVKKASKELESLFQKS